MSDKKDLYQQITDRFIQAIENGTLPWQCPWDNSNTHSSLFPVNYQDKPYQGVNTMLLWIEQQEKNYSSNQWMTLKQANAQGAAINKGEQGTPICFFKPLSIKDEKSLDKNGNPTERTIPLLRSYIVFNTDQINNLPNKKPESIIPKDEFTPIDKAERVLKDSKVRITEGGSRAIYAPSNDEIFMPDRFRFGNSQEAAESYYATALHELAHATKHSSRTGRLPYETDIKHGSYAFEELVAEISASFTLAELQLQGEKHNHESYVANWLEVLHNDKKAIFKAATQARKATEWIKEQSPVFTKDENPSIAANDKAFKPAFDQTKINQQEQIQKILSTFEQPTTEIFSSQSAANEPVYSAGKGRGR